MEYCPPFPERLLAVLDEHPRFQPELFGQDEPFRTRYVPSNREALLALWSGKSIRPDFQTGRVLLKRNRAVGYFGVVAWVRGQRKMNSITLGIPKKNATRGVPEALLVLGRELFEAAYGQYGFACERAEYMNKNMTGWWAHPRTGRLQGGKHLGFDRTRYLPGVYWANFFGPAYVEFFGAERLETAPAFRKERLAMGGVLLSTAHSPEE